MLKNFATLIVIAWFLILFIFFGGFVFGQIYTTFNPNSGEYVFESCHKSIGRVICEHYLIFKDPGLNVLAIMLGIQTVSVSAGSGFYFNENYPYALTNYHVIAKPIFNVPTNIIGKNNLFSTLSKYYFTMDDGTVYPCKVISVYPEKDMAVLLVDTEKWKPLPFAKSISIGERVYAIGSPLGLLVNSISEGIISAKGRDISMITGALYPAGSLKKWYQTTAHVNPGNSGGPLLNRFGEVIGINTISLNQERISGIYFAIDVKIFELPKLWLRPAPEEIIP